MISFFPFAKYKVEGYSMWPALVRNDLVLVYKWAKIKEDDIVLYSSPEKDYVKRVVKIEDGAYFLEGDNKKFSTDSRKFGPVKKKDIVGKVILKYSHDYSN